MNHRTLALAGAALIGACGTDQAPTAPVTQSAADVVLPRGAVPNRYIVLLRPGGRDTRSEAARLGGDHRA